MLELWELNATKSKDMSFRATFLLLFLFLSPSSTPNIYFFLKMHCLIPMSKAGISESSPSVSNAQFLGLRYAKYVLTF